MSKELKERILNSGFQAKILDKEAGNLLAKDKSNPSIVQPNLETEVDYFT